jgi:tetratricopeptide (TPR) repeat protein
MGSLRSTCRFIGRILSRKFWYCSSVILVLLLAVPGMAGQASPKSEATKKSIRESLRQHYDAARTFQISGQPEQAAAEYKTFLAEALRQIGNADGNADKFEDAAKVFAEALTLVPENSDAAVDYAALRLQQGKLKEAQTLAGRATQLAPENARAQYMLGSALFQQEDYAGAKEHLEKAVAAQPKFEIGYLLGITYIKLQDLNRATLLFNEMALGLGDSADIHVLFGRAYREGDYLDQAISELHKALVRDSKIKGAHYLTAMAYLERDGDSGFGEAVPELEAELKVNPNDARTHYMLGYIALKRHDAGQAEKELSRAVELDPENPDPLISLGQVYLDAGRLPDAEKVFRKSIAVTKDPSHNQYQVNRAHYALGRILLQTGREEEGKKELQVSAELRDKPHPERHGMGGVADAPAMEDSKTISAVPKIDLSPAELSASSAIGQEFKPTIADSYNNLGVIAAGRKDYAGAMDYFEKAGQWDPTLETKDRNFGMAAFYANQFDRAVGPLGNEVERHPDDLRARAALGLSLFGTQNYKRVIETLQPIKTAVDADPGLSYAYAVSQVKTGGYTEGIGRLRTLEVAHPNSPDIHTLIGEAFVDQGEYAEALEEYRKALAINPNVERTHFLMGLALIRQGNPADAAQEFRAALKLDGADVSSKYHLAYALIQMRQPQDALPLLHEVIGLDPQHADAYYQLGKLQLEQGNAQEAIANLEAGSRLSPDSDYIHYQLALAYRRESRAKDAEREMKVYQTLKQRHRGGDAAQQN